MPMDLAAIHPGLDVYGECGNHVGSVAQVWPNAPSTAEVADPGATTPGLYPASAGDQETTSGSGSSTARMIDTSYFQVEAGGVLRLGAHQLYVPFAAVDDVIPGDRVIGDQVALNVPAGEADSLPQTSG